MPYLAIGKAIKMLNRGQQRARSINPASGRWWLCLLTTLCFAFYVNYIPAHLASATHVDDAVAAVLHLVLHLHDHAEIPSDEQNERHTPHPASDHSLTFAGQSHTPVAAPPMAFVSTEALVQLHAPEVQRRNFIVERIKPPGESPPGPAQPRAPPVPGPFSSGHA